MAFDKESKRKLLSLKLEKRHLKLALFVLPISIIDTKQVKQQKYREKMYSISFMVPSKTYNKVLMQHPPPPTLALPPPAPLSPLKLFPTLESLNYLIQVKIHP